MESSSACEQCGQRSSEAGAKASIPGNSLCGSVVLGDEPTRVEPGPRSHRSMREPGLEPGCREAADPKSAASTSSATPADAVEGIGVRRRAPKGLGTRKRPEAFWALITRSRLQRAEGALLPHLQRHGVRRA